MLYLTYKKQKDGMGAQYQRIIGIICLAMKYDCQYIHTHITEMEHIPEPKIEYLNVIEDYFQIQNHFPIMKDEIIFDSIIYLNMNVSEKVILKCKEMAKTKNILLTIAHAYSMFDNNTSLYEIGMPFLNNIKKNIELPEYNMESGVKIAIHIRRGDVSMHRNKNRYIALDHFQKIINQMSMVYENAHFFIFTEISHENENEFIDFQNENKHISLKIMPNIDALTTLEYLIKADVLVMSISSFSYVAGLYNQNSVFYMDFWHKKLDRWKYI
jgi:hypothetical protein